MNCNAETPYISSVVRYRDAYLRYFVEFFSQRFGFTTIKHRIRKL